jgi:3-oxoacyl-[acyl-carrier protein] reductase
MEGAASDVGAAVEAFDRVDILFNGAGIIRRGTIHEMDEALWDEIMRVNLKSAYAVHHAAPHMMRQRSGSVLCVTPLRLWPLRHVRLRSDGGGLVGFTRSIARELGEFSVRCNAIRPCAASRMFLPETEADMQYVTEELGVSPVGGQWLPASTARTRRLSRITWRP